MGSPKGGLLCLQLVLIASRTCFELREWFKWCNVHAIVFSKIYCFKRDDKKMIIIILINILYNSKAGTLFWINVTLLFSTLYKIHYTS